VDPVTHRQDVAVINVTWGLGESLVGGTATPDTFVVRKEDLKIVARTIGQKHRMTVRVPGGTEEVEVPRALQREPAATAPEAIEMARLAVSLEQAMGWPVDLECAYHAGRLYLLQCRPVTTLTQRTPP
jgi:pyruvate,water dikinase